MPVKPFRGYDDGCEYCDFYQYAKKDHFCQRGKHMGYSKCGWYSTPNAKELVPTHQSELFGKT